MISQSTYCCHHQTNTNRDSANETIVIIADNLVSAVNCPIKVAIVPLSELFCRYLSISQRTHCCHQHTNTYRERQRKQDNCDCHSQDLERSQLSDKGRDRAIQLVTVESSVDFTKHTLLPSAHNHEQRHSKRSRCFVLQVRHRTIGVAANNFSAAAIEIQCIASQRLPTTETSQRLVQRSSVGRVHRLSSNSDEPAAGGNLHRKEIQHPYRCGCKQKILSKARRKHSAERTQR